MAKLLRTRSFLIQRHTSDSCILHAAGWCPLPFLITLSVLSTPMHHPLCLNCSLQVLRCLIELASLLGTFELSIVA
eukprot:scaffold544_cov320-Pavlova_lutheri.AAC.75